MAKRIVYSENALKDRLEILDYWYKRIGTKTYSKKLDKAFREVTKLLAEHPELGRQLAGREERFFVKEAYQIFYRSDDRSIEILHLWDSRRNPEDLPLKC